VRRVVRVVVVGALLGALGIGSAWAGAVLTEVGPADVVLQAAGAAPDPAASAAGGRLPGGWFLAGADVQTLVPPADRWVQAEDCGGAPEQLYTPLTPEGCLITFDMLWADGVDEPNPIEVRAQALSNGETTVVRAVMDLVGYMAAYPEGTCDRCGLTEIREDLAAELGIPAANMAIQSSHTHAAPTTIAAGPAWYYDFVRDQVRTAITNAVAAMEDTPPVRLQTGFTRARAFNVDRRILDRAVPDDELAWLRAVAPAEGDRPEQTVWTLASFAVHPTIRAGNARLHSGMSGPFAARIESALGGTAVFSPSALGDQTVDRGFGVYGHGYGIADLVLADLEHGTYLETNDIEVVAGTVQIPVENQFFAGALAAGYAIRNVLPPYGGGPLAVAVERGGARVPMCEGAGELHMVGPVSAWRIGERPAGGKVVVGPEHALPVDTDNVTFVFSPGEMFASMGLVVKDYASRSDNVFVQSMTNDTLGYMVPSNQYDLFSSEGLGLVHNAADTGNYEEALSLGRCTGDITTRAMVGLLGDLGVLGEGEGL
jgi:hypothetical protein